MKKNEVNIFFVCLYYKKEPPHLPPRHELKPCKGLWDGKSESSSLAYPVGTRRPTDVRGTYQLRPLVPVHFGRPHET